jgi:hypothetical protein
MKAHVTQRFSLEGIPSASGVELLDKKFYIISDNSPWLCVLNKKWELIAERLVFPKAELQNGVIPKKKKPDFEALTALSYHHETYLFVLGSGSKSPERDRGFLINPLNLIAEPEEVSLIELYDFLRSLPEVSEGFNLNIEAAAANEHKIFLFQRGNISGNNVMISYKIPELLHYLQKKGTKKPLPVIKKFKLPILENLQSGFSGATLIPEKESILFSASVENTANEIDDGKILGSYLGIIDLKTMPHTPEVALIMENDSIFKEKVESVTLLESSEKKLKVVAVTDSDGQGSDILEIEVNL